MAFSRVGPGPQPGRAWGSAGTDGLLLCRAWAAAGPGVGGDQVGRGRRPDPVWAATRSGVGLSRVGCGRRLGRAASAAAAPADPVWAPWCPGGSYSQNGGTSKTSERATTAAERCAASASATKEGSGSMVRDQ